MLVKVQGITFQIVNHLLLNKNLQIYSNKRNLTLPGVLLDIFLPGFGGGGGGGGGDLVLC